ncbi:putative pal1 cell morphology protein [Erysiphe necator]|uniref:Putative pal1 cell morphology protein n=1 Tax=Uncinula necator TaxID=52586 RepID=A0A0B1P828_UNCNE|nr:putative pal1 cell morphology protein [Erysiphe necator]
MMSLARLGETTAAPESSNFLNNLTSTPNFSSNNPFRNQTASYLPPNSAGEPVSSLATSPTSLRSRNPFFDSADLLQSKSISPVKMTSGADIKNPSPQVISATTTAIGRMVLNEKSDQSKVKGDKPQSDLSKSNRSPRYSRPSQQRENLPPLAAPGHRLRRSNEEVSQTRQKNMAGSFSGKNSTSKESDVFADPTSSSRTSSRKPTERRPRRNSESSIAERSKPLDLEEEKKRQERRRREKKQRDHGENSSRSRKPNRKLDVIDKLDVTSIYGTGLFHHDGPFDACNPHRNRQGSKRAPMQAFPKDSLNNVLGGGGPINKRPDHAIFMGNKDEEAFHDYSKGGTGIYDTETYNNGLNKSGNLRPESNVLSATTRVEPIHGEETLGLGTSTFLEGAPASKNAIQRRASVSVSSEPALSRSKSFAQKFRGINVPRRDLSSRITNSDAIISPDARTPRSSKNERGSSIFFDESIKLEENTSLAKKENCITIIEPEKHSSQNRFGSISRLSVPFEIQPNEGASESVASKTGIGFMSRVKSLKGGGRKMKTASPIES